LKGYNTLLQAEMKTTYNCVTADAGRRLRKTFLGLQGPNSFVSQPFVVLEECDQSFSLFANVDTLQLRLSLNIEVGIFT
jgi:hypothetical protein